MTRPPFTGSQGEPSPNPNPFALALRITLTLTQSPVIFASLKLDGRSHAALPLELRVELQVARHLDQVARPPVW